jgi:hypothetical protein
MVLLISVIALLNSASPSITILGPIVLSFLAMNTPLSYTGITSSKVAGGLYALLYLRYSLRSSMNFRSVMCMISFSL